MSKKYKLKLNETETIVLCNLVAQENKRVRAEFAKCELSFKLAEQFGEGYALVTLFDKCKNLATEANLSIKDLSLEDK